MKSKNHAPNPYNYAQQAPDPHEQLRDTDPAATVIDTLNDLRNATYERYGDADTINDHMYGGGEDDIAGAIELNILADQLRSEGRHDLKPYEEQFVKHMQLEAQYEALSAKVDFDTLTADFPDLSENEADNAGIQKLVDELASRRAASTDQAERAELNDDISKLRMMLKAELTDNEAGINSLEGRFMQAHHDLEHDTSDKLDEVSVKQTSDLLNKEDKITRQRGLGMQVLAKHFPRDPFDATELPADPRLEYQLPAEQPPVYQETAKTRELRSQMEDQEFEDARRQMVDLKAGSLVATAIRNRFDRDKITAEKTKIEARYHALARRDAQKKYGDVLNDPAVDPEVKRFVATKALFEEQAQLRADTNEKIKNKPVATIAKWVGRHKLLVVGGSMLLAPVTLGASVGFGAALAGGVITASKMDEKYRGMQSIDKAMDMTDLLKHMRRNRSGNDYAGAQEFMMKSYDDDMTKERWKRLSHAVGGAAIGGLAWNLAPATAGLDNFLASHDQVVKSSVLLAILAGYARNPKKKK